MSDLTVGPIQTYSGDSTTTTQDSVQDSASVTLTSTDLWLVDTSKLNGETSDPQTQYTLATPETKDQTTVPFENVDFTATAYSLPALDSSTSSTLSTISDDSLMLAEVTGGTQFSSDGTSLSSSNFNGSSTGTGSTGSGSLTGSSGGGGSAGAGGAPSSSSGSADGQATDSAPSTTPSTSPSTTSTAIAQSATTAPGQTPAPVPTPAPFEVSPTMGLLLMLLMFGYRVFRQNRSPTQQPNVEPADPHPAKCPSHCPK